MEFDGPRGGVIRTRFRMAYPTSKSQSMDRATNEVKNRKLNIVCRNQWPVGRGPVRLNHPETNYRGTDVRSKARKLIDASNYLLRHHFLISAQYSPNLERYCGVGTEVSENGLLLTKSRAFTSSLKTLSQRLSRISLGV